MRFLTSKSHICSSIQVQRGNESSWLFSVLTHLLKCVFSHSLLFTKTENVNSRFNFSQKKSLNDIQQISELIVLNFLSHPQSSIVSIFCRSPMCSHHLSNYVLLTIFTFSGKFSTTTTHTQMYLPGTSQTAVS